MSDFFDIATDNNLLHSSVRDHSELQNVVDKVERQIITYYSERTSSAIEVMLKGYDAETPDDSDADLKEALKHTIADVVSRVLRDYDKDSFISKQQGNRSITLAKATDWRTWPDGWRNGLHLFDQRTAVFSI